MWCRYFSWIPDNFPSALCWWFPSTANFYRSLVNLHALSIKVLFPNIAWIDFNGNTEIKARILYSLHEFIDGFRRNQPLEHFLSFIDTASIDLETFDGLFLFRLNIRRSILQFVFWILEFLWRLLRLNDFNPLAGFFLIYRQIQLIFEWQQLLLLTIHFSFFKNSNYNLN